MSVRAINRASGTAGLRDATATSIDIVADSAAGDALKYKDAGGVVRSLTGAVVVDLAVSGAITIQPSVNKISKVGVYAGTLAAPTAVQEGTRMTFISDTANAHTITATGLINDGVTGGAKNLATFAAFAGASLELVAINLKWAVVSKNAVTIT